MLLGLPYSTWIAIALGVAGFVGQWMWRRRSWKWRHRMEKKLDAQVPSERKRTVRFMPSVFVNMLQSWVLSTKDEPSKEGEAEPGGQAPPREPPQLDPSDLPHRPGRPQDDPYRPPRPGSGIGPGHHSPGGQPGGGGAIPGHPGAGGPGGGRPSGGGPGGRPGPPYQTRPAPGPSITRGGGSPSGRRG